jgi:hypothetical protein
MVFEMALQGALILVVVAVVVVGVGSQKALKDLIFIGEC